jgi:glutamyl-tRNA synthetase
MLRFAASPTGDMHISDLRVALFNYIVSRQKNEDFIIRIEDLDAKHNIDGRDDEILDILALFGVEYSQVIHQSQNVRFYTAMALQLMHEKETFSCFCSPNWLEKKQKEAEIAKKIYRYDDACRNLHPELVIDNTNPFTIRINCPRDTITIIDKIQGKIDFKSDMIDSFVIMNQDKTPTHNFACAVDDMLNNISIVIRDECEINDIPKEDHIRTSLSYNTKVEYAHLASISNDTLNVKELLKEGYLPEAISNYLILTGTKLSKKIFTLKEAIELVDFSNMSKSPTHFDINLLKQINIEHLKNLDAKELSRYVGFADEEIGRLARIYLEEVGTTKELKSKIAPIFEARNIPEDIAEKTQLVADVIKVAPYFENYNDFKNHIIGKTGLKGENYLKPIRILLTNAETGPDVAEVYKYIKNYLGEIIK